MKMEVCSTLTQFFVINVLILFTYGIEPDPNLFAKLYESGSEMLDNDIAKRTVITFLEDTKFILDNENAGDIITDILATAKFVVHDENGSKSVISMSDGLRDILTNKDCHDSIKAFVRGSKSLLGNKNTLEFFQLINENIKVLAKEKQLPLIIEIIGTGFQRLLTEGDIEKALQSSFEKLIKISGGKIPPQSGILVN